MNLGRVRGPGDAHVQLLAFMGEVAAAITDPTLLAALFLDMAGALTARAKDVAGDAPPAPACDLCGDQGPLVLRARCHFTAPLAVERDGQTLVIRCYLPECAREVARFTLAPESP